MKKAGFLLFVLLIFAMPSQCLRIDGRFWDWVSLDASQCKAYECKPKILLKDRSGLELQKVKIALGSKYLYVMLEGRSVTGQKRDSGQGFHRTSVRISFSSAQSPLNRVRVLADPQYPSEIKLSMPGKDTVAMGSVSERFWASGRASGKYAFEVKVPIFRTSNGIHIGSKQGPLVKLDEGTSGRKRLTDVLINTVDTETHHLVSTAGFAIKPGDL